MDRSCNCEKSRQSCVHLVPIFNALNSQEITEIENITYSRTYAKGEMIYMAGEKGEKLFVIHRGKVKITRISESGREQVVRVLGPGDFMGELSLFVHVPLTDNAQALEDTEVCVLDGQSLKQLMMKYPAIALKILEELSMRLEKAERLIEDLTTRSVEVRIARALLELATHNDEVVLELSKGDLASHTGMSPETLSRKLSYFQKMGWIKMEGRRKIVILDKDSLASLM